MQVAPRTTSPARGSPGVRRTRAPPALPPASPGRCLMARGSAAVTAAAATSGRIGRSPPRLQGRPPGTVPPCFHRASSPASAASAASAAAVATAAPLPPALMRSKPVLAKLQAVDAFAAGAAAGAFGGGSEQQQLPPPQQPQQQHAAATSDQVPAAIRQRKTPPELRRVHFPATPTKTTTTTTAGSQSPWHVKPPLAKVQALGAFAGSPGRVRTKSEYAAVTNKGWMKKKEQWGTEIWTTVWVELRGIACPPSACTPPPAIVALS
eukprot:SAG25_NODE_573_length_6826_cov_3.652743_5_plen_265_part_00